MQVTLGEKKHCVATDNPAHDGIISFDDSNLSDPSLKMIWYLFTFLKYSHYVYTYFYDWGYETDCYLNF